MIIWLFLTALLLSTTTFAWFSANRIFEIETFDIQVVSRGGMEISTDGINWKGVTGIVDFINANQTYPSNLNQIPSSIKPVSTGGNVEGGLLKLYYGQAEGGIDGEQYLTATRTIEKQSYGVDPDAHFMVFDLFLKTAYRKSLTLSPESSIDYVEGVGKGIENAFRVGFINQGNVQNLNSTTQIQNSKTGDRVYIWENNSDIHTFDAVKHALDAYNIVTSETNAQNLEYNGIINDIPKNSNVRVKDSNPVMYPNYFKKVPIDVYTTKLNDQPQKLFNIESGITKIRIYIWIEGQDVDCENSATSEDVLINLQLIADEI